MRVKLALLGALAVCGSGAYSVYAMVTRGERAEGGMPSITAKPAKRTWRTSARFAFADRHRDVSFQCSLDGSRFIHCASPISYRGLRVGKHRFRVRASDPPWRHGPAAQYDWRVVRRPARRSRGENFSISAGGITGGLLYPGAAPQAIAVTLANPNDVPVFVTSLSVTVPGGPAGCDSATNISLTQSNVSSTAPVAVPAHGSVMLPAQGRSAPSIQLVNLPVNQDACQNAHFPLSFTGSAHS